MIHTNYTILKDTKVLQALRNQPLTFIIDLLDELIVGETTNKITLFLSKLNYMTDKPTHELLLGPSSAGKTHITDQTLSLFPAEDIIKFSRSTPAWLDYEGDSLKNKILYAMQLGGFQSHSDSIYILLSEKGLTLRTVKATADGLKSVKKEIKGPVSFVSTSVESDIDNQLKNRSFYIAPDESAEQTERIQLHQALRDKYPWEINNHDEKIKLAQDMVNYLKHHGVKKVVIPFSNLIMLPPLSIQIRRHRPKLVAIIESLAILRQMNRNIIEVNGEKYIIAEWCDFLDALRFSEPVITQTITQLTETEENILTIVNRVYGPKIKFTSHDLAKNADINLQEQTIRAKLNSLVSKDYLDIDKGGGKGNKNMYQIVPGFDSVSSKIFSDLISLDQSIVEKECNEHYNSIQDKVTWFRYDEYGELVDAKPPYTDTNPLGGVF